MHCIVVYGIAGGHDAIQESSLSFDPLEWPVSNFSQQYHSWINHKGHENQESDHQLEKLLIDKQILLLNSKENV